MKRILGLIALGSFVGLSQSYGAIATELNLSDSAGDTAVIDVSTTGVLSCAGTACGGLIISNPGGAHGTIAIGAGSTFGSFTLNVTGEGGGSTTLPALENLNQINASNTSTANVTLTAIFTDTLYSDLSSVLNVGVSNVTDSAISTSTIQTTAFSGTASAVPAGSQIYTTSLTGHTDDNGVNGVNVLNPNNPNGSLTEETVMTFAGKGAIQANFSISNVAVPEPTSALLLGGVLLSITTIVRKKLGKRA